MPTNRRPKNRLLALWCATAMGRALTCVYHEEEPGRRSAAKLLSKDEARRIAANVAKLAESF